MLDTSQGALKFTVTPFVEAVKSYTDGLTTGESFTYKIKDRERSFFEDMTGFFTLSLTYLFIGGVIATIVGILAGGWMAGVRQNGIKDVVGFLGTIPDFILIILLQLLVILIYKSTGIRVAKVASTFNEPAVLLPLLTISLIPAIYLINSLSQRTYQIMTEDYVLTARARGLNKLYIYVQHIFRNLLPFLKADLYKVTSIMMGNLFIVEYLYNLPGMTRLLFTYGHQFNLIVNTLFVLAVMYVVFLWGMKLFVSGLERVFIYD